MPYHWRMGHQLKHRRSNFAPEIHQDVENERLLFGVGALLGGHKFQINGPQLKKKDKRQISKNDLIRTFHFVTWHKRNAWYSDDMCKTEFLDCSAKPAKMPWMWSAKEHDTSIGNGRQGLDVVPNAKKKFYLDIQLIINQIWYLEWTKVRWNGRRSPWPCAGGLRATATKEDGRGWRIPKIPSVYLNQK